MYVSVSVSSSDFWQSRVKALLVIAQLGKTKGCDAHVEWWAANGADDVRGLATDQKASVRTQVLYRSCFNTTVIV